MDNVILKTKNLSKEYDPGKGALDIDLEIHAGEIVGFIGPNSAGKTTTMRMIMGMVTPDSGEIELFGKKVEGTEDVTAHMGKMGFMPSEPQFYSDFTPIQLFRYASGILGKDLIPKATELSELLDLNLNKKFKHLSQGNKSKVGVINAILHDPELVILDEPTAGLDPLIQQKVLKLLEAVRERGGSVFLSSHVLSEVQQITDRIIMIKDSRITLKDSTKDILDRALKRFELVSPSEQILAEFKENGLVKKRKLIGENLLIYVEDPRPVVKKLNELGFYDFYLERTSLEEMFLDKYEIEND